MDVLTRGVRNTLRSPLRSGATGKKIFDLLHGLTRSEKTTIIAVTHDLDIAGKTDSTFRLKDSKVSKHK